MTLNKLSCSAIIFNRLFKFTFIYYFSTHSLRWSLGPVTPYHSTVMRAHRVGTVKMCTSQLAILREDSLKAYNALLAKENLRWVSSLHRNEIHIYNVKYDCEYLLSPSNLMVSHLSWRVSDLHEIRCSIAGHARECQVFYVKWCYSAQADTLHYTSWHLFVPNYARGT